MRKGQIGADKVNQALINLTSQGAIFAGGATAQADTLNGKLSTLQDTIDTLARTIGEDLGDEIKSVIDIAISGVKEINKLIERIGVANKVGRLNLSKIAMEARGEAKEQLKQETDSLFEKNDSTRFEVKFEQYKGFVFESTPHYQLYPKKGIRLMLVTTYV